MKMQKKANIMKLGEDVQHDNTVFLWFKQKRMGPILCKKAVQLHKKLYGDQSRFSGSTGWQWRFCKRHGICNLSLQGEKLSADKEASDNFISSLLNSLNNTILLLIRSSIAMKRNSVFACYQKSHWLHPSKNQQTEGKRAKRESQSMLVQKCNGHHQVTSPAHWQSYTPEMFQRSADGLATC